MLSKISEVKTFSATSSVTDGSGISFPVMYMSASVVDEKVNITKSIQDNALYMVNQKEILEDYATFEKEVMGITLEKEGE